LEAGIMPGAEAGEKFMAILLWSQKSACTCQACQYLREMADRLISTHIKEGG